MLELLFLSHTTLSLVMLAGFVSAFVSGFSGFGGSFILAITLATVISPKEVIPLIAVYAFFANLGRMVIYRRDIKWRVAIQFICASLPGLWLGANFLKWVAEDILLAILGFTLVSAIPIRRWLKRTDFSPDWRVMGFMGIIYGIMSGTAIGSGMFVVAALNAFGLHGTVLLGTDGIIGIANAFARMIIFAWLGLLDGETLAAGVAIGLVSLPATWCASLIVRQVGKTVHALIIEGIIAVAGLGFVGLAVIRVLGW